MNDRTTLSLSRVTGNTPEEIAANALFRGSEFFGVESDDLIVDIGNYFLSNDLPFDGEGKFCVNSARIYLKSEEE